MAAACMYCKAEARVLNGSQGDSILYGGGSFLYGGGSWGPGFHSLSKRLHYKVFYDYRKI